MATKKKTKVKEPTFRSFKRSPDSTPFYTLRFTQQTVYWIVITLLILAVGVWVLYLTARVQQIYDIVHSDTYQESNIVMPLKHK